MSDPVMQSPLHHLGLAARAKANNSNAGVLAHEVALRGYLSLRGEAHNAAFLERAAGVLGLALPVEPCTLASAAGLTVMWLSPDEWMITGSRADVQRIADALIEALAGIRSQVVVNSGGYTELRVAGTDAAQMLSHCTVYDLAKLTPGRVVGSTFGKASAYMYRDGDGFRLLVRRSFADYIWRFMERAAMPYGFGVTADVGTASLSGAA